MRVALRKTLCNEVVVHTLRKGKECSGAITRWQLGCSPGACRPTADSLTEPAHRSRWLHY